MLGGEDTKPKNHLQLADHITTFAGSMNFVWIHVGLFTVWIALSEKYPWPILPLVSLEAIFCRPSS